MSSPAILTPLQRYKTTRSRTRRSGLVLSVPRITRQLRKARLASRISACAPVYMAGAIEYLIAEVLELAGNRVRDFRRKRITPRDIQVAVQMDEELRALFGKVTMPTVGVLGVVHPALLPKRVLVAAQQ